MPNFPLIIDFLLVVFTFGLIITVHELGHFLAARWAGVRVLAFAVGFGPAAASFRQGLGLRRGSSEREYIERLARGEGAGVSPTEYRLNVLPLGGYVKMLGQDDLRPGATSSAPDSYQSARPWKRMVIISAGVVFNIITAAILFVIVFTLGLRTEPSIIGGTVAGTPASSAVAVNAASLGITEPGLKIGDRVLSVNGERVDTFTDVVVAVAMSGRDEPLNVQVARPGFEQTLRFSMVPRQNRAAGRLDIGVEPSLSNRVMSDRSPSARAEIQEALVKIGLPGVLPGMRLVRAGSVEILDSADQATPAFMASAGSPVEVEFEGEDGTRASLRLEPHAQLQRATFANPSDPDRLIAFDHLLGFTPVMTVAATQDGGEAAGLLEGDVFARIGNAEFPDLARGISEIRSHAGGSIELAVLRGTGAMSDRERVDLRARVGHDGTIGFAPGDTSEQAVMLAAPHNELRSPAGDTAVNAALRLDFRAGSVVESVGGLPVGSFAEFRGALRAATQAAVEGSGPATVDIQLVAPGEESLVQLTLNEAEVAALHELGWTAPERFAYAFEPAQVLLKADGPVDAMGMGLRRTKSAMSLTYLTFVRLFQGTVAVENLKGPVGIAHIGTLVASRGWVWLMFFAALISVNLAVINFLPLPIVDGGQFLYALYEQVTGKAVPAQVQNAAALAGLILIAAIFLFVTFNDIKSLLG